MCADNPTLVDPNKRNILYNIQESTMKGHLASSCHGCTDVVSLCNCGLSVRKFITTLSKTRWFCFVCDMATYQTERGYYQEVMNRHREKERLTSVPILCRITLQNAPYMDHKLLMF